MRYTPLPYVKIDPDNDQDLLKRAMYSVYQSSGGQLDDFTPGSPVSALLEGQIYAQAEFLHYVNSLPEALLLEWLNSFAGFQRSLGNSASTLLRVTIVSHDQDWRLPKGYLVFHDDSGVAYATAEVLEIKAGESIGEVRAVAERVGTVTNAAIGTITGISENYAWLQSITNTEAAVGGTDIESLEEAKSRAFQLIRRRNPVDLSDWREYLEDYLGDGIPFDVSTLNDADVLPVIWLRSSEGDELTSAQLELVQNKVNSKTPIGQEILVQNTPGLPAHTVVDLRVNDSALPLPEDVLAATYAQAFASITPSSLLRYQVKDLDAIAANELYGRLNTTLPTNFVGISIQNLRFYANPYKRPTGVTTEEFNNDARLHAHDLVIVDDSSAHLVLRDYTPIIDGPSKYVNSGEMALRLVHQYEVGGFYRIGDPISVVEGQPPTYVCIKDVRASVADVTQDTEHFQVSEVQDFEPGNVDALRMFRYAKLPDTLAVLVVDSAALTIRESGSLNSAILSGFVQPQPIQVKSFENDTLYAQGEYISVRLRQSSGIAVKYYRVAKVFRYRSQNLFTLINDNVLTEVSTYSYLDGALGSERYVTRIGLGDVFTHDDIPYLALKAFTPRSPELLRAENFTPLPDAQIPPNATPRPLWSVQKDDIIQSSIILYRALRTFTPIYSLEVYIALGHIEEVNEVEITPSLKVKQWEEVARGTESLIYDEEADTLWRCLQEFTPTSSDTLDDLERKGKVVKVLHMYTNEDEIIATPLRIPQYPDVLTVKVNDALYDTEGSRLPSTHIIDYGVGTL